MASESVLKSFLVRLGFKVDQQQLKNFQDSLESTGKNAIEMSKSVLKYGAAIGASMTGVYAATALTAKSMDGLYWSGKRIGTTVGDLESIKRAAEAIAYRPTQCRALLSLSRRSGGHSRGSTRCSGSIRITQLPNGLQEVHRRCPEG